MKALADLNLENKATFLRLDLNVPIASRGEVRDDFKIENALPTIKAVLAKGARLAIGAHLGRPHGAVEERLSLAGIGTALAEALNMDVILAEDCVGDGVKGLLRQLKPGSLILLENLRFNSGEVANDEDFAKELAAPFEAYICDAFAASHRRHASLVSMSEYFQDKCLGPACQAELAKVREFFAEDEDEEEDVPFGVVIGGRSYAEKAPLLQGMLDYAKVILVGGGVANTLLAAKGVETGRSKVEKNMLGIARSFLRNAEVRGVDVVLPVDHQLVNKYSALEPLRASKGQNVEEGTFAVDIGPVSVAIFKERLTEVKRALFCGPLGVSEWENTSAGSKEVARSLIKNKIPTIFGGGELLAQLSSTAMPRHFMKCTAGSALLTYLTEGDLPALKQFADHEPNALVS